MYASCEENKGKENEDVLSKQPCLAKCEMESLGSQKERQKRNNFMASLCSVFPDLAALDHPPLQAKTVLYTMMRDEPPQLSLLFPLQGKLQPAAKGSEPARVVAGAVLLP